MDGRVHGARAALSLCYNQCAKRVGVPAKVLLSQRSRARRTAIMLASAAGPTQGLVGEEAGFLDLTFSEPVVGIASSPTPHAGPATRGEVCVWLCE